MAEKEKTPSFIIELELKTSIKDEHILNKRIKLAIMLYNMALNYSNKKLKAVRADKEYRGLLKEKKKLNTKKNKEQKKQSMKDSRK